MNINELWNKLIKYEGEEFYTKTGLPFEYRIINDEVIVLRKGKMYHAYKNSFLLILNNPFQKRSFYTDNMWVSSYILGIMHDARIGAI